MSQSLMRIMTAISPRDDTHQCVIAQTVILQWLLLSVVRMLGIDASD